MAAGLAAASVADWMKPAQAQLSVRLYNQGVERVYRGYVRPTTSRFVQCRFQPTCSYYSIIAMQTYGFPKGLWLTVKRLCRCLPWVQFGTYDPVPPPSAPEVATPAPDVSGSMKTSASGTSDG